MLFSVSFKAALNVVVAAERGLDSRGDLTDETTAQIGLYAHLGQDSRTSGDRPGAPTPAPPLVPMPTLTSWDAQGAVEELRRTFFYDGMK